MGSNLNLQVNPMSFGGNLLNKFPPKLVGFTWRLGFDPILYATFKELGSVVDPFEGF